MAQHIDIQNINHKRFRQIENSIFKHFAKGLTSIRGSLKFEQLDEAYKEDKDELVFGITYKIPYDEFVYKSDRGYFEIHYNNKQKKINKIYLVA